MLDLLKMFDRWFVLSIRFVCVVLITLMTIFVVYTVVMRYVFLNPPFWGDTLAVFANIWFVLLAFALAVHDREHIAMQAFYEKIPRQFKFALMLAWDVLILAMGVYMLVYGLEYVDRIRGSYHELGGLPKSVPVTVIPVFGVLTVLAVSRSICVDIYSACNRGGADAASGTAGVSPDSVDRS